jgi:hypothetical protein
VLPTPNDVFHDLLQVADAALETRRPSASYPVAVSFVFGKGSAPLAGMSDWVCPVCSWDANVDGSIVYSLVGGYLGDTPVLYVQVNCPRCANTTLTLVGDPPVYGLGVDPTPP